jgi:ArsR family transcriptional regulator
VSDWLEIQISRFSEKRRFKTLDSRPGKSYRNFTMKKELRECDRVELCPPAAAGEDLRPVEGAAADEELAALAKAVGHPARVRILRILARRDSCVCGEIVGELPLAQSTVSQHLKVLKEAGLIRGEVDGPRVCYCIDAQALRRLKALVAVI